MKIYTLLFTLVFTLTISCTKEKNSSTQAELTTIQLQNVIKANNIQRVLPFEINYTNNFVDSLDGKTYTFSNGFITFSTYVYSYNLSNLRYYQIQEIGIGVPPTFYHSLVLYFEP